MNLPKVMMGDRCLIEIVPETTRQGLIVHRDNTDPRIGIVRAIGNGRRAKKSKQRIPIEGLEIGDRVCVAQFGKWYATIDDKDYWVLESKDLLAKLEPA